MMLDQSYSYVDKLAKLIKLKKDIPIILGGASPTAWTEIVEEQKNIDAVCFMKVKLLFLI